MNILIMGAGKAGRHLYNQIKQMGADYKVVGFVDNFLGGRIIDGIKISTGNEFVNDNSLSADCAIIAAGAQKTVKIMMDILLRSNISNIYLMQDIAGKNKLAVFDNNGFDPKRIRKIRFSSLRPTLPYFEMPITDSCNLNCKGCLFVCNKNIGESEYIPYDVILNDVMRMSELFEYIPWIRILGGEPLMHPDIEKILVCFRKYFPNSDIDLCTNGLLLTQMEESFFVCMAENDISIHISGYPPVYNNIKKIEKILEEYSLQYVLLDRGEFVKFYTLNPVHDPDESYVNCLSSGCREVYRGRISNCSAVIAFDKLNQQFGTEYCVEENKDWFDIHNKNIDAWKLIDNLEKPANICSYCNSAHSEKFEWGYSGAVPSLEDYII